MSAAPHGSWPTPFVADLVVAGATTVTALAVDGEDVWWSEMRAGEGGRTQVLRRTPDGAVEELLPAEGNARTAVHEYGGGAWWVRDGALWWTDWADQRLRRRDPDGAVTELTEPAPEGGSVRWADGDVHADGRVVVVRETHPVGGRGPVDVVNEVVVLHPGGRQEVVVSGPDFVADPRWSPDGEALAWLEWDHPDMPWDASRLVVRRGDAEVVVAGEDTEEGVCQPSWAPDGTLWFCSDREDDWALFSWTAADGVRRRLDLRGDVGTPHWIFGPRRHVALPGGRVLAAVRRGGRDRLHLLDADGSARPVHEHLTEIDHLAAGPAGVVALGSSPYAGGAALRLDLDGGGSPEQLSPAHDLGLGEGWQAAWVREPELVAFPGAGGATSYAQLHLPANPDATAPEGELPPLVVTIHGGPTSAARTTLAAARLFWTSRGFAVADVDYAGSTGYGRAYRNRLWGEWGVADVADCLAVVEHLAAEGRIDGSRAVIRGGSAGGFTVLLALTRSAVFAAGADYFGVADAEGLARETHKFESRYLDRLVAPYPEGRETYRERSAIHHLDSISSPLVVLQGAEDKVVPQAQSDAVVEALRARGLPVAYRLYPGEQHGFRRAENLVDSLHSELSFYAQVLGFDLPADEGVPRLEIENL